MKNIFSKSFAAMLIVSGLTACSSDLDISSIDPQSSPSYEDAQLLAKQYGTLGLTGQKGTTGNGDITMDEGESGFYRCTFNCQELPTDECIWAWQTDTDIPQLTNISWNSSSKRTQWVYNRLGYNITLYNFYLSETANRTDLTNERAEVRFLRALHYWYFLDLFHKAPFKTTFNIYELPVEKSGKDLYEWLDNELTELEADLADIGSFNNAENFGRADKGAAYILHARLALNSPIYTDGATEDYAKAKDYCDKVISSGKYALSKTANGKYSGYAQLFMADNDENLQAMKEIIFPIRQDGLKTRSYSGSTYLVCSMRIAGMPDVGTTNAWSCNFARGSLVEKFFPTITDCPISTTKAPDGSTEADIKALDAADGTSTAQIIAKAGDDRAMLYGGRGGGLRKLKTDKITNFLDGMSIVKWDNHRLDGAATHDVEFPDVDIPLIRYAEAYLTRAEVLFRTGFQTDAMKDINVLRDRAHAKLLTSIDERTILDEWCREFYMEGRRRSDLVRFNCFTTKNYIWDWKGGVENGTAVDSHYNVYPIPVDDINNNKNMSQNKDY